MKRLSFFALCAIVLGAFTLASCEPEPVVKPIDYSMSVLVGNSNSTHDGGGVIFFEPATAKAATLISYSQLTADGSKEIVAIRVGIAVPSIDCSVWIAEEFNDDPLVEVEFEYDPSGWTYVKLPEAFKIPENRDLWLGYTITSTEDPLILACSGSKTPICKFETLIQGKKKWTNLKNVINKGSFCIQAVCVGGEYDTKTQSDLAMLKYTSPVLVNQGENFTVDTYVGNLGTKSKSNIEVTAEFEGQKQTKKVNAESLTTGQSGKVSFSFASPATPFVPSALKLSIPSDDNTKNNNIEFFVSTYSENAGYARKAVLIEQFTTEQCLNCPEGTKKMKEAIAGMEDPSKACWVAHHAGYGTDFLTITENEALAKYLGVNGAPTCAMDRTARSIDDELKLMFHPGNATSAMLNSFAAGKTGGDISMTREFNAETKELKIIVTGTSLVPNIRLSALLVQNNIQTKEGQSSLPNGVLDRNYIHNNSVRKFFTAVIGDAITVNADKTFSKEFTYVIPASINGVNTVVEDLVVIAYIAADGASLPSSTILNTVYMPVVETSITLSGKR